MTWSGASGAPWWFVGLLAVAGGLVGEVLRRRLATGDYRLDDECGPLPRVSPRIVPVALALLWALLAWRFGPLSEWALSPAYLAFAFVAVALTWIDADVHRLPRGLTRPAYPLLVAQLALASLASGDWAALRRAAIAGAVLWLIYFVLALVAALLGSGFGFGDVTLAGLVGLATGYVSVSTTLVASYRRVHPRGALRARAPRPAPRLAQGRHRLRAVDAARLLISLVVQVGPLL